MEFPNIPFLKRVNRPLCPTEEQILAEGTLDQRTTLFAKTHFQNGALNIKTLTIDLNELAQVKYALLEAPAFETVSRETLFRIQWLCEHRADLQEIDNITLVQLGNGIESVKTLFGAVNPEDDSLKVAWQRRFGGIGRFYADFGQRRNIGSPVGGLINISRSIRDAIFAKQGYFDIDQTKSYPTLVLAIARLCGIHAPSLTHYLENSADFLQQLSNHWSADPDNPITPMDTKKLVLRTLYGGGLEGWLTLLKDGNTQTGEYMTAAKPIHNEAIVPALYSQLKKECEAVRKIISVNNPDLHTRLYPPPKKNKPDHSDSEHDRACKVSSYFFQTLENHFTYAALEFVLSQNIAEVGRFVWGYDGVSFVLAHGRDEEDLVAMLGVLNTSIHSVAFPVSFALKPVENQFPVICDNNDPIWQTPEFLAAFEKSNAGKKKRTRREEIACDRTYLELKDFFEEDHFKIEQEGRYAREFRDGRGLLTRVLFFTAAELMDAYKQWSYVPNDENFLKAWTLDRNLRLYSKTVFAPPPQQYDETEEFNLWTFSPYHKLFPSGAVYDAVQQEGIDMYLDMTRIATGSPSFNTPEFEYLLAWDCDMLQYPGAKSLGTILCCQGSEGTGKSMFGRFKCELVGSERSIVTKIAHVTGQFNGILEGKIFVQLDEMENQRSKGPSQDTTATLKSLVTDKAITYNNKFQKAKEGISFHRWMTTSNDPAIFDSGRRPFYLKFAPDFIETDENGVMIGKQKALAFVALLDDKNEERKRHVFSAIYHYIHSINMEERFGSRIPAPPDNEINRAQKMGRSQMSLFADWLINTQYKLVDTAALSGAEIYDNFKAWLTLEGAEPIPAARTPHGFANYFFYACSWGPDAVSKPVQVVRDGTIRYERKYDFKIMRSLVSHI